MEHLNDLTHLSSMTGITDSKKISSLVNYASEIYSENKKYNLTGHRTLEEILENLIIGSLEPVKNLNVPRGTLFADIGTGSGIPGVPLAVKYDECTGILFDSNQKKIRFINKTTSSLSIDNVTGSDLRVEDAARDDNYRGKFDIVFTRAMSDIYTIAELGSPLLKIGGFIFLYVNRNQVELNDYLMEHISAVGLSADLSASSKDYCASDNPEGLVLRKINETDIKYPRRMPVIKRMSMK